MYTLNVLYFVREDANFFGLGGYFDNDGVRTSSPQKKGQSMIVFATEKKDGQTNFLTKINVLIMDISEKV